MSTAAPSPHHTRCGPDDLMAIIRTWEWENEVRRSLTDVIAMRRLDVVFQGIYRLGGPEPVIGGYEALARFPTSPGVPTLLWFRVAAANGLGVDLELAAAEVALGATEVPDDTFLGINSTPDALPALLPGIARCSHDCVVEIGYTFIGRPDLAELVETARSSDVRVAVDDVPLGELHLLERPLGDLRPDMVKIDLLGGFDDEPMARFNLASGLAWCASHDIEVVAERVETRRDVEILSELGVDWAQGYALSKPAGIGASDLSGASGSID